MKLFIIIFIAILPSIGLIGLVALLSNRKKKSSSREYDHSSSSGHHFHDNSSVHYSSSDSHDCSSSSDSGSCDSGGGAD